ncbi:hypothetical protein [Cupriavidus campinensis]
MDDLGHHLWALTDHVCRHCFARVLARPGEVGDEVFRCSNCGSQAQGADERVVCACGLPGARCEVNDSPTPLEPGEIVAVAVSGG